MASLNDGVQEASLRHECRRLVAPVRRLAGVDSNGPLVVIQGVHAAPGAQLFAGALAHAV